jgi:membrane associated rhomboid family serine protease
LRTARFGGGPFQFGLDITPTVRNLLIATFGVWGLQIVLGLAGIDILEDWFALDPSKALPWQPWRLVSYVFLHSAPSHHGGFTPWHVIVNMFTLAVFGGAVERQMGSRRFLVYYLLCGLGGGLLTLLPWFDAITVGASGAVLGVLTAFGLFFPNAPVLILVIMVPAKIVVLVVAIFNLVSAATAQGGISYIAHVGGMAAGWLLIRGQPAWDRALVRWREQQRQRREQQRVVLRHRMDEILDKMNREGRKSLSQEEWRILLDESKRMRNN